MRDVVEYDEVGLWSEIKLDIIREYATAYSTIMNAQTWAKYFYIDAFAGAGKHKSKTTKTFIKGSPTNALYVTPKFTEYYFVDINRLKVESLRQIAGERQDVSIFEGDCNAILLNDIFPKIKSDRRVRALCILDPYGLHLDWHVIQEAGLMNAVDIFINFPVMDINMNVGRRDRSKVLESQVKRMDKFWGDSSWQEVMWTTEGSLFEEIETKVRNDELAEAFRVRLKEVAGFGNVPKPIEMRSTTNSTLYYLFFASPKAVGGNIVRDIFKKYSSPQASWQH
ncbi:MAG: three-Cys-motif partner protein TcmP [Desulfarculaceae bacterium]|nr:three-Cys-motif partner protein TcmP [Desulfarculaceae bacterium]MCF8074093.1 three-Cys-motif partner protein TcmP [Desulfarculaceae bacterium]MCF8103784.1 three-Cys-motif partner protein TcmP [Desulfarculaceae bacterium]MCF8116827.1 three-Cys-motif partner protein TcmP [Desulfarculaceae bacterium]